MTVRRAFAAIACALFACAPTLPPRGQILLYLDTDAPLGPARGLSDPIPLFDRIRVDVIAPGAASPCATCTNEFAIDKAMFDARNVSIGILPSEGQKGARVRVRMFRAAFSNTVDDPVLAQVAGEPDRFTTIDVTTELPAIGPEGVVERTLDLFVDDVGQTITRSTRAGRPESSRVGKWPDAERKKCEGTHPNEACVPGGAFWIGSPPDQVVENAPSNWRRLAVVSPFFIQLSEVMVGEVRASNVSIGKWSGSESGLDPKDWCTFTITPMTRGMGSSEVLPANCIGWIEARQHCLQLGADLPTETQLEYLLGGLRGERYVWGNETPSINTFGDCMDEAQTTWKAVWARSGYGILAEGIQTCLNPSKDFLRKLGGPEPPGTRTLDDLWLPQGTVHDLAGNLGEWTLDNAQKRSGPCWSVPGVLRDPLCTDGSNKHVIKGGAWDLNSGGFRAWQRYFYDVGTIETGFRCARRGAP